MKVFFSHSSRDKSLVREIKNHFPDHFSVWIDEKELLIGRDLSQSIKNAISSDEVDFVVLFLSTYALSSNWVEQELKWALEREKVLKRTFVIPVLLEDILSSVEPPEIQDHLCLSCFDQSESFVKYFANHLYEKIVQLHFSEMADRKVELKSKIELKCLDGLYHMRSYDEIYNLAIKLVDGAKSHIYSTAFGGGKYEGRAEFIESLAKAGARNVHHKVVYSNRLSIARNRSMLDRKQAFEKMGASEFIQFALAEPWGADFLIVDNCHVHLSYHQPAGDALQAGLEITNTPNGVKAISEWFEKVVWNDNGVDFGALL
ncbi:toll/interleukin-1 receptor domain-containing protein [Gimesia aquarii]|uniref:TIR domain-containing protein n=1 Tax=Gimesia aquarii TaxID=2527964 RepID=A0A517VYG4_9PLAN|nr:toll/interleukin-1 receptor domain-containing protein [Gimesia aquarii]QDT98033.1 hypothetical protein V144x_35170 [Gimesia aquarii]